MWIKICGNTSLADAQHAARCGASALGFIFAPSPRQVTPLEAHTITAHLPRNVERYGVFVHADFETIVGTVREAGLTGVQLHMNDDSELPARLRSHFAGLPAFRRLSIVAVLHFSPALEQQLDAMAGDPAIDAVLVDSRTVQSVGGTGIQFDWQAAQQIFRSRGAYMRLIVGGGLNPQNVEEALSTLAPWGVDVVTGVESSPGSKDPMLVELFIQNARRGCALLDHWRQQLSARS